jgi:hypothetical protein
MAETGVQPRPSEQEYRELVGRIVASTEFRRATRLRDFLLYVVDRKLADSSHELTEVFIGQRVFGRPPTYNPSEDSIVRTEARNLRQRLERYFAGDGREEPIILEIPKGGYLPVFRLRQAITPSQPAPQAPPLVRSRRFWLLSGAGALLAGAGAWKFSASRSGNPTTGAASSPAAAPAPGSVQFEASDSRLVNALQWARQRALGYAYSGDPVGDWYDSTAGTRYAFCMRDVSHQATGAAVLGLAGHSRNMLRHFAASISGSRDWCGYWEINKDGFPAPIDYTDDAHFWYCLPANFDVMQTCYRQYLWTGDRTYFDGVFSNFYDRSVTSYVEAWDRDHNGLMESGPEAGRRGIPSYYQEQPRPLTGGDLVAAQYRGYLAYAAIQEEKGARGSLSQKLAAEYRAKADTLRVRYNTEWWDPVQNRHYQALLPNHQYYSGYIDTIHVKALWFGITEPGLKTEAALDLLEKSRSHMPQVLSYFPDILFRYGRKEAAYEHLLEILDPDFPGRGMPEVVYAAVGAAAAGLMGISPDAPRQRIETFPRLPDRLAWARLSRVPVLRNEIAVLHRGSIETTVTNQAGPAFEWKASFPSPGPGREPHITVDGSRLPATSERQANDQPAVGVRVQVGPGQSRTARLQPG